MLAALVGATLTCVAIPVSNAAPDENAVQRAGTLGGELDPFPQQLPPPPRELRPGETPPPPHSCRSVDLASPDNECTVFVEGQRDTLSPHVSGSDKVLVTENLTLTLTCSTERGGFGQTILVTTSANHRLGLQWIDAHRLTVGIPVEAHFSPPVEHVDNLGEPIDIRYVAGGANGSAVPPAECLPIENPIPSPNFPDNLRQLVAPRSPEDWSTIEVQGHQCSLLRSPSDLGRPRPQPSVEFHQYAKPGLPFGTRELVFVVKPPGSLPGVKAQLRLDDGAPVALIPNGSLLRGWRATGHTAERVLRTLRMGRSVQLDLLGDETAPVQMFVDSEDIAGAAGAFEAAAPGSARPDPEHRRASARSRRRAITRLASSRRGGRCAPCGIMPPSCHSSADHPCASSCLLCVACSDSFRPAPLPPVLPKPLSPRFRRRPRARKAKVPTRN